MKKEQKHNAVELLKNLSIDRLNTMQEDFIERSKVSNNISLLAPTGTGKTLAFLIPLINQLNKDVKGVQALIIAPSRELSIQIEGVLKSLKTPFKVSCCYGGHSAKTEQNSLQESPEVVIGTPGRISDHILRKSFDTRTITLVVVDEFDKSLQLGFHDQLKTIFKSLSGNQRHYLTSATQMNVLPDFLPFSKPEIVNYLKNESESKLVLKLVHTKSEVKVETLMRLVAGFENEMCLVFCNHRDAVDRISALLTSHNFVHGVLHGGMEQIDREKNLIKFKSEAYRLLIATDLAARGLDIEQIRHIVHYQLPPKKDQFIHRKGRTARMHCSGEAYLILANDETLPDYIDKSVEEIVLPEKWKVPELPNFVCLYFSGGKKDKISKGDIVGLLTKKCGLAGSDIGTIVTLDYASYVSVKRNVVDLVLTKTKNEKIKKLKLKIEIAD